MIAACRAAYKVQEMLQPSDLFLKAGAGLFRPSLVFSEIAGGRF